MKIFSWVHNKVSGRQTSKTQNLHSTINHAFKGHEREEFSDWPQGLLAIGTFGNKDLEEDSKGNNNLQDPSSTFQELNPEELGQLQKELNAFFSQENVSVKSILYTDQAQEETQHCQTSISVAQNKGQDVCFDNTGNGIGKKSLSFLLKKMFVCRSGFARVPSFKDPLAYPESRMEKILRKILKTKIYPQGSSPAISVKKLQNREKYKAENTDEEDENCCDEINRIRDELNEGSKWVKTDTEYIVLEI